MGGNIARIKYVNLSCFDPLVIVSIALQFFNFSVISNTGKQPVSPLWGESV